MYINHMNENTIITVKIASGQVVGEYLPAIFAAAKLSHLLTGSFEMPSTLKKTPRALVYVDEDSAAKLHAAERNQLIRFTPEQIAELRKMGESLKRVDPDSPTLAAFRERVKSMSAPLLRQLIEEQIPWLRTFAQQELTSRPSYSPIYNMANP